MILKLFNLNKSQLEQNIVKKQKIKSQIHQIENEIENIKNELNSVGVEKHGAIGDFKLLALHKISLKYKNEKLAEYRNALNVDLRKYDIIIIKYQKEMEKYTYLLNLEKKKKIKELEKYDENIASEYIQAKFIKNMKAKEQI